MGWGQITGDHTESRDDILTGGGEVAGWGQIMDATVQGAGMTYDLEVESVG